MAGIAARPGTTGSVTDSSTTVLATYRTRNGQIPGWLWWARLRGQFFAPHGTADMFAAMEASTPTQVLRALSRHPNARVRVEVALNPRTPRTALDALYDDEEVDVLVGLAGQRHLAKSTYQQLALRADAALIAWEHRGTDGREELERRVQRSWQIIHHLTRNPDIPDDVFDDYSGRAGNGADYGRGLCMNPVTPAARRKELVFLEAVGTYEAQNPALDDDLMVSYMRGLNEERRALCSNLGVPESILIHLALESDQYLAIALANPNWPVRHMAHYTFHPEDRIRKALAKNPRCPANILIQLAHDESDDVRRTALAHPKIGKRTLYAQDIPTLINLGSIGSQLRSLDADQAEVVLALANGWGGTLKELTSTSSLIGI